LAAIGLVWQIAALILVPTAACCQRGTSSAGDMANCPMHRAAVHNPSHDSACPMAQAKASHECHCPKLSCSQTDQGFTALLGPIGILPQPVQALVPEDRSTLVSLLAPSSLGLAPAPSAPPPRV